MGPAPAEWEGQTCRSAKTLSAISTRLSKVLADNNLQPAEQNFTPGSDPTDQFFDVLTIRRGQREQ